MRFCHFAAIVLGAAFVANAAQAAGDPDKGKRIFMRCAVCHSVEADGPRKQGPSLHGIFGRKAGSLDGYSYSTAMKNAGFVWDEAHLDQWLTRPSALVPGTKMIFVGIPKDNERADVIAYLKQATQ